MTSQQPSLDEQAKWEFIQEIERYHRKLRHIQAVRHDTPAELIRQACEEHIARVTGIYMQFTARRQKAGAPAPWATSAGLAN